MENTDDKNVSIGEWRIENEMVTGPESVKVLRDVTYDFARRNVLETTFLQEDTSIL